MPPAGSPSRRAGEARPRGRVLAGASPPDAHLSPPLPPALTAFEPAHVVPRLRSHPSAATLLDLGHDDWTVIWERTECVEKSAPLWARD